MFDARIFPTALEHARNILLENKALFKGEYVIDDTIFASKDPTQTLDTIFLRLRVVPQNIWGDKAVVVAIKSTELKEVGKQSIISVKEQFDTKIEGQQYIDENYADTFEYAFEFRRKGWQYDLGEDQIDLEDIENGIYSIEFKSKTQQGLRSLLELFTVEPEEVIKGPSVVVMRDQLKKLKVNS